MIMNDYVGNFVYHSLGLFKVHSVGSDLSVYMPQAVKLEKDNLD